jgi:hypothetical protein
MPVSFVHHIKHFLNKLKRNILVKKIAHRINKDLPRLTPPQRLLKQIRMQSHIEIVPVTGLPHGMKPSRHPMSITVLTSGTDLRAAGHRIPGCISPFNRRVLGHIYLTEIRTLFADLNMSLFVSKTL